MSTAESTEETNMAISRSAGGKVLEYKCATSVAPQLLETGTVTISYNDDETEPEYFQLRPHLIVLNITEEKGCQAFFNGSRLLLFLQARFVGISLEPIFDGRLARDNPHSTAKTAVAVGGVVSVAVDNSATPETFSVGKTLIWDASSGYAKININGKDLYAAVPSVGTPNERSKFGIGVIVDNDELVSERYVRVKLF